MSVSINLFKSGARWHKAAAVWNDWAAPTTLIEASMQPTQSRNGSFASATHPSQSPPDHPAPISPLQNQLRMLQPRLGLAPVEALVIQKWPAAAWTPTILTLHGDQGVNHLYSQFESNGVVCVAYAAATQGKPSAVCVAQVHDHTFLDDDLPDILRQFSAQTGHTNPTVTLVYNPEKTSEDVMKAFLNDREAAMLAHRSTFEPKRTAEGIDSKRSQCPNSGLADQAAFARSEAEHQNVRQAAKDVGATVVAKKAAAIHVDTQGQISLLEDPWADLGPRPRDAQIAADAPPAGAGASSQDQRDPKDTKTSKQG